MARTHPRNIAFLVALLISGLLMAGCSAAGDASGTSAPSTAARGAVVQQTLKPRPATGAARYLPDLSTAGVAVDDIDLAAKSEPLTSAVGMLEQAIGDDQAPRYEVDGVESASEAGQVLKTVELTRTAMNCLNQRGHLAMHAYVDAQYRYSMAIALVVRASAFKNIDVAWCAVSSSVPYQTAPSPGRATAAPSIAPCVGQRRAGPALITWVGTTDAMCAALGNPVLPVTRTLARGDSGTDVARLQLALVDLGSDVQVDGYLGPATISAVRAFQRCFGVSRSGPGVAGEATFTALDAAQTSGWSKDQCPA